MTRLRQYFQVVRADGKPPNFLDYLAAALCTIIMAVFMIIPYLTIIAIFVSVGYVVSLAYRCSNKVRGKTPPSTFS